ncbi:MAG TPA: alpha/beta hydrolase [Thermoleophilaceae bacterium]|nr:alpha/beta hydrolase [Thermoleophilaceae bacterium]
MPAGGARADSHFSSGGSECAAWLYEPEGDGPHPCVVMAHGFSAVREQRLDAYAERFAAAGMAVLVFDYRHFGASQGEPRQLLSIARQLADWHAAVAHARNLPGVDARRVAVWGSSFSGGHVIAVAAKDPAIAAVVSQAPFTDGLSAIAVGGAKQALKLTGAGMRDAVAMLLRREPSYLPAVGPPGTLAVMTAPEAQPGFEAMDPPGSTWQNRVAGRVALMVGGYRPYAKFGKLRQPVFVAVCEQDATTPSGPAVKAAEKSPNAELVRYPIGHFEIYVDPQFETTVADQTDFLVRNLVGGEVPVPAGAGA